METIGTLRHLRRYPVKSMAGEDLAEAYVSYSGLVGDRAYAFVQRDGNPEFPWLTARQVEEMLLFRPRFTAPPEAVAHYPDSTRYGIEVTTPQGQKLDINDPRLKEQLEKRLGREIWLRFSERAMTDARPVSLFGLPTAAALSQEVGISLHPHRFRANFYAEWKEAGPYFEDTLVGRTLQVGEQCLLHVSKKDGRCKIITLDPETAAASPQVLATVAQKHEGCIAVYLVVLREGVVRTGDSIRIAD
ncbi:MAG TPA: MOSC N-terminal beta barrel domain-containing protein [Terriglobales bacterium]|nr:MOSC N-terminal beta barrel domain-containing protein [Terriglobales bacterium]